MTRKKIYGLFAKHHSWTHIYVSSLTFWQIHWYLDELIEQLKAEAGNGSGGEDSGAPEILESVHDINAFFG